LIDSTLAVSMSAEPDVARLCKCCDSPERLTLASPEAPAEADAAVLAPGPVLAAGGASPCCERDKASFNVGGVELVVESTFTIGFLNDLILITAIADQNFSAIARSFSLSFKGIRPRRGPAACRGPRRVRADAAPVHS
jgi:hypothetical protein